jgi:hypothetical protein
VPNIDFNLKHMYMFNFPALPKTVTYITVKNEFMHISLELVFKQIKNIRITRIIGISIIGEALPRRNTYMKLFPFFCSFFFSFFFFIQTSSVIVILANNYKMCGNRYL